MINMILLPESQNTKTGNIIQSYSSSSSCPVSCPFKESGCYAKNTHTAKVWERADDESDKRFIGCQDDLADALTGALWMDKGDRKEILFRHNIAGDMAVVGTDKFDLANYLSIVSAIMTANYRLKVAGSSKHIKAFTYTHCDYSISDRDTMQLMKYYMLVNISCETVDEVATTKEYGLNAVLTSINPEEDIAALKAKGIPAVQCPAQTKGLTCKECRICSRDRESVVLFEVHGQSKGKARRVIQIKRA
jgi:hypothetical protein